MTNFERPFKPARVLLAATTAFSLLIMPMSATVLSLAAIAPVSAQSDNNYNNAPRPVDHTSFHVPAGTEVHVRVLRDISSADAQVGDHVRVAVASDDKSGLPVGTIFLGQVTDVRPASPDHAGYMTVQFHVPSPDSYQTGEQQNGDQPNPDQANPDQNNGATQEINVPVDASAKLKGTTPHKAGNVTGIAAAAGALLGFARKRKLGDAIAGGAIGAVGGVAVDQSQKRSASDVNLDKGSEIMITLDKPLTVRTIVVPDSY